MRELVFSLQGSAGAPRRDRFQPVSPATETGLKTGN
jgi:hypothetical protein